MNKNLINKEDILKIYTDGAARGNPGPAACCFLFVHDDKIIHKDCDFIGNATNNTAEYRAIINALKVAEKFHTEHLQVFSDSYLAIQQINRKWKINSPHLSDLHNKIFKLSKKFGKIEFIHVKRNNPYIKKCDILCNERLNAEGF